MKPTPTPIAASLELLYAPIAQEMLLTERMLREQMRHEHAFVDELVSYGCLLGGKRLRPALLHLSGKAVGQIEREHYLLATVVEMIHTATLVHDDILDGATTRRHLATVNIRWDNEAAVLLGDYLFTHSFYLASTTGSTTACRLIGEATNRVCEGEIKQKGSRGNLNLTEAEYFAIIDGKTAALTECSCRLGAIFAGASEADVEHVAEFGRLLGLAFQIADDLLDVLGEQATVGKTLGTDLEKQKPTLPLIHTWQLANSQDKEFIQELWFNPAQGQAEKLLPIFEKYDSIAYARNKAFELTQQAREHLLHLPHTAARETLLTMAEFVVQRSS
jgi:octaprenyl-diphosphate synthase